MKNFLVNLHLLHNTEKLYNRIEKPIRKNTNDTDGFIFQDTKLSVAMKQFFGSKGILLFCLLFCWNAGGYAAERMLIFAAASTTNALTEIAELFEQQYQIQVTPSFASSSTLAKQIAQGAPASIYLSANPAWMNSLEEQGLLWKESRQNLLSNRLVLVTQMGKQWLGNPQIHLQEWLANERLVIADPTHVPAGMYTKQALKAWGLWDKVQPFLAPTSDVRKALLLLELEEASLGIIYATDALISTNIQIVAPIPSHLHEQIVYPVAILQEYYSPRTKKFFSFLQSKIAQNIFLKYGFLIPSIQNSNP